MPCFFCVVSLLCCCSLLIQSFIFCDFNIYIYCIFRVTTGRWHKFPAFSYIHTQKHTYTVTHTERLRIRPRRHKESLVGWEIVVKQPQLQKRVVVIVCRMVLVLLLAYVLMFLLNNGDVQGLYSCPTALTRQLYLWALWVRVDTCVGLKLYCTHFTFC